MTMIDDELLELIARLDEDDEHCDLCILQCKRRTSGKNPPYPCNAETRRRLRNMGRRLNYWKSDGNGHWKRVV